MTSELIQRVRHVDNLELRDDDDGHYVRGVVAPYGEAYDAGDFVETFAPGLFARSISVRGANHVPLTEMHNRSAFPIGKATTWEETTDGLVGQFRLAPTEKGREALDLVRDGFLDGMSVGFRPQKNAVSDVAGRRHILREVAALDHVGLVHSPAFASARVLEARDDDDEFVFDPDNPAHAPRLARYRALLGMRNR